MKYYEIIGDFHPIQGTSAWCRAKEFAEECVSKFLKIYPEAKCEIKEVEIPGITMEEFVDKHIFHFLVLY